MRKNLRYQGGGRGEGGVIHGETKGKQWLTIDYTETQRLNNTTPGVPEGLTVLLYQRHLDVGERYRKYI